MKTKVLGSGQQQRGREGKCGGLVWVKSHYKDTSVESSMKMNTCAAICQQGHLQQDCTNKNIITIVLRCVELKKKKKKTSKMLCYENSLHLSTVQCCFIKGRLKLTKKLWSITRYRIRILDLHVYV